MAPSLDDCDCDGTISVKANDNGLFDHYPQNKPYTVAIASTPVTYERIPYVPQEGDKLIDAGTARANIAPSNDQPQGSLAWSQRHRDKTVVEQHAAYFDRDQDGIIWPLDTYNGCRDFGWNIFLSALAMFIIHLNLSYPTQPSWLPDPFFRIFLKRTYKNKHGSDSMSIDNEGRFRPQSFEDFFHKYDRDGKGGLDPHDIMCALKGQAMVFDLFGISAATLEWFACYLLVWPEDNIIRKEDARRVIDGSYFQIKADEYAAKTKARKERMDRS